MGAAGDMLAASLIDLFDDKTKETEYLNSLGVPGVVYTAQSDTKCGITGTHLKVTVNGEEEMQGAQPHSHSHAHHSREEINKIISALNVSEKVRNDIFCIYDIIAQAESEVHGVPVGEIHFHEVGALDAVADITAVCALIEKLAPGRILASPVNTGSGTVKCSHGIVPVPAPATALILKGISVFSNGINSELCTPTGAAILKHFARGFDSLPLMSFEKTGYGTGKKDFETANCVRAILGEADERDDFVYELSCNIDDMTAEETAFAAERCFEAGALDVYTIPAVMKKGRSGIILCVLCTAEKNDEIVRTVFKYTSTIGIRQNLLKRYTLNRETETVETPLGEIRKKISHGYGVTREKYEYDDLAALSIQTGKSIDEIKKIISEK